MDSDTGRSKAIARSLKKLGVKASNILEMFQVYFISN